MHGPPNQPVLRPFFFSSSFFCVAPTLLTNSPPCPSAAPLESCHLIPTSHLRRNVSRDGGKHTHRRKHRHTNLRLSLIHCCLYLEKRILTGDDSAAAACSRSFHRLSSIPSCYFLNPPQSFSCPQIQPARVTGDRLRCDVDLPQDYSRCYWPFQPCLPVRS